MKYRNMTKIISCILCTAMSMQVVLALTDEDVNAAESITVEGIYGGFYYHGELTLTAPDGYEMWCSHLPDEGYQDSVTIDQEIVENSDVYFTLRNKSDGTTQTVWLYSVISDALSDYGPEADLVLDNDAPYIGEEWVNFGTEDQEMTSIYDGAIIIGERLDFEVDDVWALKSVVVTVNGKIKDNRQNINDTSSAFVYDIEADVVNHVTITAIDDAENEFSVSFVMIQDLVEFNPTVSVEPILIGGTPAPSFSNVPDDYDGEPDISYWDEEENEVDSFDSAGTYTIFVSFPSTDLYTETVCDSTFEVSQKTFTPEVTVADILIGDTPAPSISNVPDDYNGTREIRYLNEEENETTTFDTAGEYTVEVSFPETDSYEATSCSSTFVVGKKTFAPEVSIEDFYVGSTPAPSYSNVPDDYDGELEIYYFTEDEEEVTEFNAAGSYFVTVIFPETDIYEETACNDYFGVNEKETFIPSIKVDDINVGGTIELEPENIPEDYDGEITYEFKISTAADTTYTDEIPEAAGTYIVKASFSSTDKFEGTTCTDSFTISKYVTTAEVSVDDILVGETVDPEITVDPEDYDGELTIEYRSSTDTEYSATVPTAAGTYTVRVTLPATEKYLGTSCMDTFAISKNDFEVSITVDNILVGESVEPKLEGVPEDYDGEIIIEYKSSTETDYSATVPAAAGTYTVRATLPATDTYSGTSCTNTFTISKIVVEAEVSVDDIFVGGTVDPVVTVYPEDYDGTITFKYRSGADGEYTATVPTAAGTYEVLATLAENDKYLGTSCTGTFTISKIAVEAEVSVNSIFVGGTVNPVVTVDPEEYNGEISYRYKRTEDANYTSTIPSSAGTYEVLVILPATDKYLGTSCTDTFTISKNGFEASVTVEDVFVGDTVDPELDGIPEDYDGEISIEYKSSTDKEYSTTVPTAAGEYEILVTLPATDKYLGTSCSDTFIIGINVFEASVTVEDIFVGDTVDPELNGIPEDYDGEISIEYKSSTDEEYSTTVPAAAGEYDVLVTLPATYKYSGTSCTDTFTISKYETSAEVSVDDIFVGETVDPEITVDPVDYDGEISIEYRSSTDTEYSATVPTAAGAYTVRVTLPATEKYLGTSCTDTFTISRNAVSASVSVDDIFVGETVDPEITVDPVDYDGEITIEYKSSTDTEYSATVPTAAGTYTVRVTLPATDKYLGTSCTDTFTISKYETSAEVSVDDIFVGETVDPEIAVDPVDYDGEITIEYKSSTDEEYSATVPTAAGEYEVLVTLPATDKYLGTSCTDTFTISRNAVSATVSVDNIFVGEKISPVVTTDPEDYDGEIIFEYRSGTDTEFSGTVPYAAGTYTVRATLPATDKYLGTSCTDTFTISKREITATVTVDDIPAGRTVNPVVTVEPEDYDGKISFRYRKTGDTAYSSEVPATAGTYEVMAILPATDKFFGTSCTATFTILKSEVTATVSVDDIFVGGTVSPVVTTDPEAYNGNITFEYRNSSDTDYSAAVPTAAGNYMVRATLSETESYYGTSCTGSFTIKKNIVSLKELTVEDIYYGQTVNATYDTDSDGNVTIMYKDENADDSGYSTTAPTEVGSYVARASVTETAVFESDEWTTTFNGQQHSRSLILKRLHRLTQLPELPETTDSLQAMSFLTHRKDT